MMIPLLPLCIGSAEDECHGSLDGTLPLKTVHIIDSMIKINIKISLHIISSDFLWPYIHDTSEKQVQHSF